MKQRFHIDTSVFGGYFDSEFETEIRLLFNKIRQNEIICVYSELTENELENAPMKVLEILNNLSVKQKEKVAITDDAIKLAETYLAEKVVGESSYDDCLHIATATIHKVDLLVSWNFKHIVNIYRIRGCNSINLRLGYNNLAIHSLKEIVNYGNAKSNCN